MTPTDLRLLEQPIAPLPADELPSGLVDRVAAYNAAVGAFRALVRQALDEVQAGGVVSSKKAEALRACAADLVTARAWLLRKASRTSEPGGG
ncbi:MAG TPA: hypothetical protein VIV57_09650 [Anaeromyxobacter sp.]